MEQELNFARLAKGAARAMIRSPYQSINHFHALDIERLAGVPMKRTDHGNGCYGLSYGSAHFVVQGQLIDRARAIVARHRSFSHHIKELRHAWKREGGPIYYADNSVEIVEVSQLDGSKRQRMIEPPRGDACF